MRALHDDERDWMREVIRERWGSEVIVGRGHVHLVDALPALVAFDREERVGLLVYRLDPDLAEIITLDALRERVGVARALIEAMAARARDTGAARLLVMTTNDNLRALRLYQRAGFRIVEVRPGAVDQARASKPSIPLLGHDEIPIRDEIDLVRELAVER